jgi:hypothetical protein
LLGEMNPQTVKKSSFALLLLGWEAAGGRLIDALPKAILPRHRLAIVRTLLQFVEDFQPQIAMALADAYQRESDPQVTAVIGTALVRLTAATFALGRRRADGS